MADSGKRKAPTRGVLLTAVSLWFACCASATMRADASAPLFTDEHYGSASWQTLYAWCHPHGERHTAIILIHGGGWHSGDREDAQQFANYLFDKGFAVFNVNYQLTAKRDASNPWPGNQIGDLQLALRWIDDHASEYGIDSNNICSYGFSAGGYLALMLGLLGDQPYVEGQVRIPLYDGKQIKCVVDFFGPTDLVTETGSLKKTIKALTSKAQSKDSQIYTSVSPINYISGTSPPVFISHGDQDSVVSISQSKELLRMLQSDGVNAKFVPYHGEHSFHGLSRSQVDALTDQSLQFIEQSTAH